MLSLSIVYLHSIRKKNRRHYSLSGFTLRSISVSALCQRCERILAQDDFTWSSLHLHPYPLSFTPSLSLSFTASLSPSFIHSISIPRFLSVRATAIRLPLCLFPSIPLSPCLILLSLWIPFPSSLHYSLSPLYYRSVSNASFYCTCAFCQHCLDSHTRLQTSRPGSCPVCVQCLACWHLDATC